MKQSGINMEVVKINNRASVVQLINRLGPISRKDIAAELGLTPAAVTLMCSEFIEKGLIIERGEVQEENRAGRRKVLLDINYDFKYIIGINIEQGETYVALCDLKGNAIAVTHFSTHQYRKVEDFFQKLQEICEALLDDQKLSKNRVLGIGVGIAGLVDKENGISIKAYGIWEKEVPIRDHLQKRLNLPVYIENNVNAFALGELIFGVGKEKDNLLFVKWGPGVGCAIVMENHIYEGRHGKAAELGHYIVEPDGEVCQCGRRGCLETKISYRAIYHRVANIFSEKQTPQLYQRLNGTMERLQEVPISVLAQSKDAVIQQIMEESIDLLARVLVNAMTILAPNRVILYGPLLGVPEIRERLIDTCKCYEPRYDGKHIIATVLSEKENYIGPIALVIHRYFYLPMIET